MPSVGLAADLDSEIREQAGVTTPVEFGSGWYLRGDIGTYHGSGTLDYAAGGSNDMTQQHLGDDLSFNLGFGHIFNDRFRADVTVSHTPGFNHYAISPLTPCGGGFTGDCLTESWGTIDVTSVQANAYVTLGEWNRIRPYAGAGVGLASVSWDNFGYFDYCQLDPGEDCAFATHSGGAGVEVWQSGAATTGHDRSYLFVGSIMLGADYRVSDRVTVDVGYKYSRAADIGFDSGEAVEIGALNLHEVRMGLRYEIW
ncbi:MAG: outer membrane beta-barrel protein [Rhizobiaceae bacterium]